MRTIYLNSKDPYIIGKTGESQKTALRVDVEEWYQDYPSGAGVLLFVRPNKVTYPLETNLVVHEGKHYLETIVTTNETKLPGWVVITAQWYDGETLLHGRTYSGKVLTSNGTNVTDGVQETTPTWVAELIDGIQAINETAATVQEAYDKVQYAVETIDTAIQTAEQTVAQAEEYAEAAAADAASALTYKNAAATSATSAAASAEQAMDATPDGYAAFVGSMAGAYSTASGYAVGDYVLKDGQLYKCNTAIDDEGEAWEEGHWTEITAGAELTRLHGSVAENAEWLAQGKRIVPLTWTVGDIENSTGADKTSTGGTYRTDYLTKPASGTRIYAGERPYYMYRYGEDKDDDFISYTTIQANASANIGEWSNTAYIRIKCSSAGYRGVRMVAPQTLATLTDMSTKFSANAPYVVEPAVNNKLIFASGESNSLTVDMVSGTNALIVLSPNMARSVISYANSGLPLTVQNTEAVIYDVSAGTLRVVDPSNLPGDIAGEYTILMVNHYGRVKGPWYKWYLANYVSTNVTPGLYYDNDYLPDKLAEIREKTDFTNGVSFAFCTDLHFQANNGDSKYLLKEVLDNTNVPFVIFGGDYVRAYGTEAQLKSDAVKFEEYVNFIGKNFCYGVRGNHDFTIKTDNEETTITGEPGTGYTAAEGFAYNYIMRQQERYANFAPAPAMYGYIDIPNQKTRIFLLNNCETQTDDTTVSWGVNYAITQAQVDYVIQHIREIDGWTIVFVGHITPDSNMRGYFAANKIWQEIGSAVNGKTTLNYTDGTITVDTTFANTNNVCACYICGHGHRDLSEVTDGFLSIMTTCDARYQDDGHGAAAGTITEHAFDVYCIDTSERTIYAVRIGRGVDRSWTY